MTEQERQTRVAFLPEGAGGEAILKAVERARALARECGLHNARLSLDKSLESRADIVDAYGREFFGADLSDLEKSRPLPAWLAIYKV